MRNPRPILPIRRPRTAWQGITTGVAALFLAGLLWRLQAHAEPGFMKIYRAISQASTCGSTGAPCENAGHAQHIKTLGDNTTQVAQRSPYSVSPASNITSTEVYLPLVRYEYNWKGITEWTPWAFPGESVVDLLAGPAPGQLWVITRNETWEYALHRSTDFGKTWERADAGLGWAPSLLALEDSPLPDAAVYAAHWYADVIYVSHNGGVTWTLDVSFGGHYLDLLDFAGDTLYAQTYSPCQVWQRLTTGEWQLVGDELDSCANDLAVYQSTLYAGTSDGLYRLMGDTWEPVAVDPYAALHQDQTEWISPDLRPDRQSPTMASSSGNEVHSIIVHDGVMFVGATPRGLYRSSDGETWTACDIGFTGVYYFTIRKMVASSNGRLYAATSPDGVFVSDSQGDRWQALDAGLPHSTTGFGVLLDDVAATALTMVRDEGDEQTLGAVFNDEGVWFLTVADDTLLPDLAPQTPPKAVLVVGPIDPPDHTATRSYIAWADRLAEIMARNGVNVVKVYWPDSTWENVREAIGGASIIVYKGHGFGLGDIPADPTDMHGSVNGFCLVNPEDPSGARLGTQDMLVTTNRLAEDAIGFFFCCYCAGSSSSDPSPVSEALARRRIEAYSSTVMRMGGGSYFSGVYEEALLEDFFAHPEKSLGELYVSAGGVPDHVYPHILWPDLSVWFDGDLESGWGRAFVGDPDLTANDVLGR